MDFSAPPCDANSWAPKEISGANSWPIGHYMDLVIMITSEYKSVSIFHQLRVVGCDSDGTPILLGRTMRNNSHNDHSSTTVMFFALKAKLQLDDFICYSSLIPIQHNTIVCSINYNYAHVKNCE